VQSQRAAPFMSRCLHLPASSRHNSARWPNVARNKFAPNRNGGGEKAINYSVLLKIHAWKTNNLKGSQNLYA